MVVAEAKVTTRRVLVVDNDPDALELVRVDLAHAGHEIVGTALQGDRGIDLWAELRPDVVVVDYRMPPGPNGIEVAKRILQAPDPPDIIIYTNYRDASISRRARKLGVTVLPKGNIRALRRRVTEGAPTAT